MPSNRSLLALFDIRDNVQLAWEFTAGMTAESFEADRRTFYAVTRCIEIISEASRRLPQKIRDEHPELPWQAIMGSGNVYRHDYDDVREQFIWRTVQHSLAPLLAVIETEIAAGEPPSGETGLPDLDEPPVEPEPEPDHGPDMEP